MTTGRPKLTILERLGTLRRRLMRERRIRAVTDVMAAAGDAGGPFLASGLAFGALFAVIPALLFVVGLVGFVIGDQARAQELILSLLGSVPALGELASVMLTQVVDQRDSLSLVGIVGLAWAASGFYGSLDDAMRRLLPGDQPRGVIEQRLRGLVAVSALVVAVIAAVAASSLASVVDAFIPAGGADVLRIQGAIVSSVIFFLVVWLVYVVVPRSNPGARIALVPALVMGTLMGLLSTFFGALAPLLVGGRTGVGVLAAIFAALVWLRLVFEALTFGAAWTRIRRDRARIRSSPPTLDG